MEKADIFFPCDYSLEKINKFTVDIFVRVSSLVGALKLMISSNVLFSGILASVFSWPEKMPVGEESYRAISHAPGWAVSLYLQTEQVQRQHEEQKKGPVCSSCPTGQPPGLRV